MMGLPREAHRGAERPAPAAATGVLPLADLKVLVVDDEPDTRDFLAAVLRGAGAEFQMAASAAEALALLDAWRADVLVSDIGMPGQDGLAFIRTVRALSAAPAAQIPALAVTGYATRDDVERTIAAGFQRHVSKPIDPSALVSAVADLAKHRLSSDKP